MTWNMSFAISILPQMLAGLLVTVEVTLAGTAIAVVLGLVVAVIRRSRILVLRWLFNFYVLFIRGTPLLIQAYCAFYILPNYGLSFSPLVTGITVIGINYSAYTAEVYRAGINDVAIGQWEACTALSLPGRITWARIILPQAVRRVIPMLGNYLVQMFKDSAILFAITVYELMGHAVSIGSDTFRYVEPLTLAGLLYFLVSFPSAKLIQILERHLAPTN